MAYEVFASVDICVVMEDLRLVRAYGERAECADGEEEESPLRELLEYD